MRYFCKVKTLIHEVKTIPYPVPARRNLRTDLFNPLMPGGNKKVTKSRKLQVYLSMCDLFVTTRH